ncbi:MAG: hypothetical protein ACYCST_10070 [Acidimicrobiales bacterium]
MADMGSCFIDEFVEMSAKVPSPFAAYEYLHARDLHDHGHGGYTGSWAEVPGLVRAAIAPFDLPAARAYAYDRDVSGAVRKWETGEFVSVSADDPSTERAVTVSVHEDVRRAVEQADWLSLTALVDLLPGEHIAAVTPETANTTRRHKVTVSVPQGKVVTRFFVIAKDGRLPTWDSGYATQSAARLELAVYLTRHWAPHSAEVVAIRRRENGEPLVKGTSEVTSKTTLTVTIKTRTDDIAGWYCYAVASS